MNNSLNFTWIDNFIAGSSIPNDIDDLKFLKDQGIQNIISLTENIPLVKKYKQNIDISFYHIPVNFLPTDDQLNVFIDLIKKNIEKKEKTVIHCQFGQERTGIFLVFYLCYFNKCSIDNAIKQIRKKRPKSLRNSSSLFYLQNYIKEFLENNK